MTLAAEVVGSRGQPFKKPCWSWTQPSSMKVSYRPPLPTNESISCIQPLPHYLTFFRLVKAWHWCLLTHWMEPDAAHWFWSTIAHLKHMLCFSMLGLAAQLLLARTMFQIYRKFTAFCPSPCKELLGSLAITLYCHQSPEEQNTSQ